jgi:hypothetical protein
MVAGFLRSDGDRPSWTFEHPEHQTTIEIYDTGDLRAFCACGATWTYDRSRTFAKVRSIWESHLSYFNRPLTQVL